MGGGRSQKGGKHGDIGRALAHDLLHRQHSLSTPFNKLTLKGSSQGAPVTVGDDSLSGATNSNSTTATSCRSSTINPDLYRKYKERNRAQVSVYERNDLDEFTLAACQGVESYISKRLTREVGSNFEQDLLLFLNPPPSTNGGTREVMIPIPRRSIFFSDDEKLIISSLNKMRAEEARNRSKKYWKKRNKKTVDLYMHGQLQRPLHGYYNRSDRNNNKVGGGVASMAKGGSNSGELELNEDQDDDEDESVLEDSEVEEEPVLEVEEEEVEVGEEDEEEEDEEELNSTHSSTDSSNNTSDTINPSNSTTTTTTTTNRSRSSSTISDSNDYYVNEYLSFLKGQSKQIDINRLDPALLDQLEVENFYKWRAIIADIEGKMGPITPYEKNLEFWRQLWRVIERSQLVLVILDSRNPLFFRIPDLEDYIKQIDHHKQILLVLNKADFLSQDLRLKWSQYFTSQNVDHVFFSSIQPPTTNTTTNSNSHSNSKDSAEEECKVLNVSELLRKIKSYQLTTTSTNSTSGSSSVGTKFIVGFIGYPNVGKSSLINSLLERTKTSVGVQPGKTKHMQTLYLKDSDIILCDCPGLIFPRLVSTKYHLLINNIVSTSHFKGNMVLAVQLICNLIPSQLCQRYDLNLEDLLITTNSTSSSGSKVLFSLKVLETLCRNRNYFSGGKGGQLDYTRACRLIINDYNQGVLLHCHEPPNSSTSTTTTTTTSSSGPNDPNATLNSTSTVEGTGDGTCQSLTQLAGGSSYQPLKAVGSGLAVGSEVGSGGVTYLGTTAAELRSQEEHVNQWLKDQLRPKDGGKKVTKRKMRFLIKGKRKNSQS